MSEWEAGTETNEAVAEVLGWTKHECMPFSTDDGAAMGVAKQLGLFGPHADSDESLMWVLFQDRNGNWIVGCLDCDDLVYFAKAPTFPLVICRAILKMKGKMEPQMNETAAKSKSTPAKIGEKVWLASLLCEGDHLGEVIEVGLIDPHVCVVQLERQAKPVCSVLHYDKEPEIVGSSLWQCCWPVENGDPK